MAKLTGEARIDALCKELSEKFGMTVSGDVFDSQAGVSEPKEQDPAPLDELGPRPTEPEKD